MPRGGIGSSDSCMNERDNECYPCETRALPSARHSLFNVAHARTCIDLTVPRATPSAILEDEVDLQRLGKELSEFLGLGRLSYVMKNKICHCFLWKLDFRHRINAQSRR